MSVFFREMKEEDLAEVANIFVRAYSNPPWNEEWSYERALKRIREVFETDNSICVVCVNDNKILGAVLSLRVLWTIGYQIDVRDLFVDNCAQRKKIGSKLLECLPHYAPKDEKIDIVLSTKRDLKLTSFYEKNGFVPEESFVYYFKHI